MSTFLLLGSTLSPPDVESVNDDNTVGVEHNFIFAPFSVDSQSLKAIEPQKTNLSRSFGL